MESRLAQLLCAALIGFAATLLSASDSIEPTELDRRVRYTATGLALPNTPINANLSLSGDTTNAWKTGPEQHVLLAGNVKVAIGSYLFSADKAAVTLSPLVIPGPATQQVAVYLQNVKRIGEGGPVSQEAPYLLITAVLRGKVELQTNLLSHDAADGDTLFLASCQRVERLFQAIAGNTIPLQPGEPLTPPEALAERDARRQQIGGDAALEAEKIQSQALTRSSADVDTGVDARNINWRAGRILSRKEGEERYTLLIGEVAVLYNEPQTNRLLTLKADKAVIFTDSDLSEEGSGDEAADRVRGVYLEDNVIVTDGQYTMRGPRVYYDFQSEKAIVLDAVFFTWDVKRQLPLYVRASQLRQHSMNQWSARDAQFTTSEFGEPHFAIGVNQLTITQEAGVEGVAGLKVEAEGISPRIGNLPVFYWPKIAGSATEVPIKGVDVGHSSRLGGFIETRWDLFALLNKEAPTGMEASLLVDGFTKRGPALGIDADYDVDNAFGELSAYYLYDQGEDKPGGRHSVEPDSENRGRALWRHRHLLPDDWQATIELAYLSDETFLEEFFRNDAMTDKEYESLIYLKKQQDDWAFTFLTKYDLLDFVPQTDLLQGRGNIGAPPIGYTTEKLPEIEYYRIATPLWEDRLTWYSENRASIMRLNLPSDSPRDRGFNAAEATALFGILAGDFEDNLSAAGIDDDTHHRVDSRQELQAPMVLGPVNITPYVVGRITVYDEDFDSFAGNDDAARFWGAAGIRAGSSFSSTWNEAESRLLDVHRLRHIVEPSVNVFFAETTVSQRELPVFDYDVESLSEGLQTRLGVRNTLQTQRGGPGHWQSVDWIRVDTDVVLADRREIRESPIARFIDYRPEHSLVGDHLWNEAAWQVTDTLAAVGNATYSMESSEIERWNAGFLLDHTPKLTSFVQYRNIHAIDSSLIRYGIEYLLTPKYHVGFAHSYDLGLSRNRGVTMSLTRRLPRWLLISTIDFDQIEDVTSFGVALVPEGIGGRGSPGRNPFLFDQR